MLCSHSIHHLRACARCGSQSLGRKFHAQIIKLGLHQYGPLPNSLLQMYGKYGVMDDALQMFDEMPQRDLVSWASTLTAYNYDGLPRRTLSIFAEIWEHDRLQPDHLVIASFVKACASLGDVRLGKQMLAYFVRSPFFMMTMLPSPLLLICIPNDARQQFTVLECFDVRVGAKQ